jgi:CheY-like chemotaxis protein
MRVLICDDDASTRFVLRRHLEPHFACTVVECSNGKDALDLLAGETFDLLLLDLEMPSIDGALALERLRASEQTRRLPVIVVTRERKEQTIVRLIQLGITDYIAKPLRAEVIVAKVGRVLKPAAAAPSGAAGTGR